MRVKKKSQLIVLMDGLGAAVVAATARQFFL